MGRFDNTDVMVAPSIFKSNNIITPPMLKRSVRGFLDAKLRPMHEPIAQRCRPGAVPLGVAIGRVIICLSLGAGLFLEWRDYSPVSRPLFDDFADN